MLSIPLRAVLAYLLVWIGFSATLRLHASSPENRPAAAWIHSTPKIGGFALFANQTPTTLLTSPDDHPVVQIAAQDLASDLERVTGVAARLTVSTDAPTKPFVLIGTLGKNALIDDLVARGQLDVASLRDAWESFLITTVENPFPGVAQALVIVGSDRRGTAYGVYELSQVIGVSPWHWWSDVTPQKKSALYVEAGTRRFGPPSVKYRGIFINDEDWALQPWAAKTFEPEHGGIGPKTYAKVFELLLRLKANTLWPAMHACTKPFNYFPENAELADRYAIIMGSSHAEPMLRNNVTEWTAPHKDYNYVDNRDGVHAYWDQRVAINGRYENIYTLGMRGIHDSAIQGTTSDAQRIQVLEQVFADQRAMLARHVSRDVEQLPQMFCAYKEVLELYRQGLRVPDDVTIVWPDDNFGYIRNFATPEERKRKGGFGVYNHLSYLGRPMAYLWLNTTPPAQLWSEMHRAYEHGADRIWILNVGDIKPGEIGTELFLQMAWDIEQWTLDTLPNFLTTWATREFGVTHAGAIATIMDEFYQLNFVRKPEHLQWWLPRNDTPRPSPFTTEEVDARLTAFSELTARAEHINEQLTLSQRDAFYQLVLYPVKGSSLANERYFATENFARSAVSDPARAATWTARAHAADTALREATRVFNEEIADGKWRHFMTLEPADHDWKSMRIAELPLPPNAPFKASDFAADQSPAWHARFIVEAESFETTTSHADASWRTIPRLGRGDSVTLFPSTAEFSPHDGQSAPRLSYRVDFAHAGDWELKINLLPTHALRAGGGLRFGLSIGDGAAQLITAAIPDGSPEWAQGVLNNLISVAVPLRIDQPGIHTIHLHAVDGGVVIDQLEFILR